MNKYSNGCAAHDMREVQLMNKIHRLEVRNARMREALEAALPYLGCVEGCNCGMQKAKDVVEAALEEMKDE